MSGDQIVYPPLIITHVLLACALHRVYGRMCLIILLSVLGPTPHVPLGHTSGEIPEPFPSLEGIDNAAEVDSRVEAVGLRARV